MQNEAGFNRAAVKQSIHANALGLEFAGFFY